jgi:hypothetical protein
MPTITPTVTMRLKKVFKPVYTVQPSISGTAEVGGTLTWNLGTVTAYPAATVTPQVWRDGVYDPAIDPTETYAVVFEDVGVIFTLHSSATNSKGTTVATPAASDVVVATAPFMTMDPALSITDPDTGASLTFSANVRVGTTLNEPWILNEGGFTVTADSPACAVINSFIGNGLMIPPFGDMVGTLSPVGTQGFDAMAGSMLVNTKDAVPYLDARNSSPTKPGGVPLVIPAGWQGVIVKSLRRSGSVDGTYDAIQSYAYFNVVTTIPAENSYPLAPSDPDYGTIYGRADAVDTSVWRSLAPFSGMVDAATCLSQFIKGVPIMGWCGEPYRKMNIVPGVSGYSSNIGSKFSDGRLFLHSNAVDGDKKPIRDRVIMRGIHAYGAYKNGWRGAEGAGQGFESSEDLFHAGMALGNADMLAAAADLDCNITSQYRFITAADVGIGVDFPGAVGRGYRYRRTYKTEQIGWPEWQPGDNQMVARYRSVVPEAFLPGIMSVLLLQNGPGGMDGAEAIRGGGAFDATNNKAASTMYLDRMMRATPHNYNSRPPLARHVNAYNDWRATIPATVWTGVPDAFDQAWLTSTFTGLRVTAASGGFAWDFSGVNFAGTMTQFDMARSLDRGVNWVVHPNVPVTSSVSGLMHGAVYWTKFRFHNASGPGDWSPIFPIEVSPGQQGGVFLNDRNKVTTTGSTAAAAPVNVVQPYPAYKPYPLFAGPEYEALSGGITAYEAFAGVGDWTGYPAPTYGSYRWKLDGVNVAAGIGGNDASYLFYGADAGKVLTFDVVATNASGTPTATSTSYTIPAASGNQAVYYPKGPLNGLPRKMIERWSEAAAMTLQRKTVTSVDVMQQSVQTTSGNRLFVFDDLMPIGPLTDAPEGEALMVAQSTNNSSGIISGVGVRCTGASAAVANGYFLEVQLSSTITNFNVYRIVNGTRSLASNTSIAYSVSGVNGQTEACFRYSWQLSGANLVFGIKTWPRFFTNAEGDQEAVSEPVGWNHTWTDTSPLASGEVGISGRTNSTLRNISVFSLGVGHGVTAPTA